MRRLRAKYTQNMSSQELNATELPVFTIGHSTRSFTEVIDMLRAEGVRTLVDVRSFPSSRKFPQWNLANIEIALPKDMRYLWIKKLGGRRHTPAGTPTVNGGWQVKAFRDYADYMATSPFNEGLHELLEVAATSNTAIMCSEAVPWRCHRRLITDALLARGVPVYNIISPTSTKAAALTPFAKVAGDTLTYPPTVVEAPGTG